MTKKENFGRLSRRHMLKVGAASALAAPMILSTRGFAQSKTLVVRDPGGVWRKALTEAFYTPFEAETGIKVNAVLSEHDPSTLIKGMVDTNNVIWDVIVMTKAAQDALPLDQYFVPLDMTGPDVAELAEQARTPYWMGISVYAMVLAYNSKKYGSKPPTNWGDLWDVKGFPGARSLRRHAIDTFEVALLADGTAPDKVFPLDIDRALKKLGEIKSSVDVWWTGGAQTTQMLKSGEVDLCMAWNARAQAAIDDGAPYELCWDKAVWGMDGMCVPKRAKNEEAARNFIRFCANAKRQAVFAKYIGYGPSNPNAFEFIDPARAKILPTDPSRFGKMVYQDPAGWGPAKDKALAAFDAWIIKS